jgi:hypothetical protein
MEEWRKTLSSPCLENPTISGPFAQSPGMAKNIRFLPCLVARQTRTFSPFGCFSGLAPRLSVQFFLFRGVTPRLPKLVQTETKAGTEKAFDMFVATYASRYPKATECPAEQREAMLVSCDFPAEHRRQIRSTDPIESTPATFRLRTRRTKGRGIRSPNRGRLAPGGRIRLARIGGRSSGNVPRCRGTALR